MELKDHLSYLKRYWIFIVVFGVVCAGIAWYVSSARPASYNVVQSYEVELVNRSSTDDYQFGSFYDLQGAELFTQHMVSLLHSAAVIEDIYEQAGIVVEIDNLNRFTNQFKTNQDSNQHFTVTFGRFYEDEALVIADAMTTVLTERAANAQVSEDGDELFRLRSNEPVVLYTEPNVALSTVVALIAGWALAIILLLLKRYLATESSVKTA